MQRVHRRRVATPRHVPVGPYEHYRAVVARARTLMINVDDSQWHLTRRRSCHERCDRDPPIEAQEHEAFSEQVECRASNLEPDVRRTMTRTRSLLVRREEWRAQSARPPRSGRRRARPGDVQPSNGERL